MSQFKLILWSLFNKLENVLKKIIKKDLYSTIFPLVFIFYKYKIVLWKFVSATSKIRAMQIRAMRIRASRGMTVLKFKIFFTRQLARFFGLNILAWSWGRGRSLAGPGFGHITKYVFHSIT